MRALARVQSTGDYFAVRASGGNLTYTQPPIFLYGSGATDAAPTPLLGGTLAAANASVLRDTGRGWELLPSAGIAGAAARWHAAAASGSDAGNVAVVCGDGGAVAVLDAATAHLVDVSPPAAALLAVVRSSGAGGVLASPPNLLCATVVSPVVRATGLAPSVTEAWFGGTNGAIMRYTPIDAVWVAPTPANSGAAAALNGAVIAGIAALNSDIWAVGGVAGGGAMLVIRVNLTSASVAAAIAGRDSSLLVFVSTLVVTGLPASVTGGAMLTGVATSTSLGLFATSTSGVLLRWFLPSGATVGHERWVVVPVPAGTSRLPLRSVAVGSYAIAVGDHGTVMHSVVCATATGGPFEACTTNTSAVTLAGGLAMVLDTTFPVAGRADTNVSVASWGNNVPLRTATSRGTGWILQWNGWQPLPYASVFAPVSLEATAIGGVGGGASCLSYMYEIPGGGLFGTAGLAASGDQWHGPNYLLYCNGMGRRDWRGYTHIQFYVRAGTGCNLKHAHGFTFTVSTYNEWVGGVNVSTYTTGGVIDFTWRLVSIPFSALKAAGGTASWDLSNVERLSWGPLIVAPDILLIDEISVVQILSSTAPSAVQASPVGATALRAVAAVRNPAAQAAAVPPTGVQVPDGAFACGDGGACMLLNVVTQTWVADATPPAAAGSAVYGLWANVLDDGSAGVVWACGAGGLLMVRDASDVRALAVASGGSGVMSATDFTQLDAQVRCLLCERASNRVVCVCVCVCVRVCVHLCVVVRICARGTGLRAFLCAMCGVS